MFKVVVLKGEDYEMEILPGDFRLPGEIIEAYPMLGWMGEDLLENYMKDVLYDETVYDEFLTSIYEKEWQGNGTHSYFTDNTDGQIPAPNAEQLKELRKYMIIFITFEK